MALRGSGGVDPTFFGVGSGTTTLTAPGSNTTGDVYADTIVFSGSGVFSTGQFRYIARRQITINAGVHASADGGAAVGSVAGAPGNGGGATVLGSGNPGATGVNNASGNTAAAFSGVYRGVGGIGGTGGTAGGSLAGGSGGSLANTVFHGAQFNIQTLINGYFFAPDLATTYIFGGGSGGGSGGSSDTTGGDLSGGGGGGGGVIFMAAPIIDIEGSLTANGGAGGVGHVVGAGENAGGGGGGGGVIVLVYSQLILNGTLQAGGGAGGTGSGVPNGFGGAGGNIIHVCPLSTSLGPVVIGSAGTNAP